MVHRNGFPRAGRQDLDPDPAGGRAALRHPGIQHAAGQDQPAHRVVGQPTRPCSARSTSRAVRRPTTGPTSPTASRAPRCSSPAGSSTNRATPIAGAQVDTWHSDGEGFYDVQQTEKLHDEFAMRALLTTDDDGRFWYRSITPRYYPVPTDGPCGEIMRAANRSRHAPPARALLVPRARDTQSLITQLFYRDDPYIDRDAVFADVRFAAGGFRPSRARDRPGRDDRRRAVRDLGLDLRPRLTALE